MEFSDYLELPETQDMNTLVVYFYFQIILLISRCSLERPISFDIVPVDKLQSLYYIFSKYFCGGNSFKGALSGLRQYMATESPLK